MATCVFVMEMCQQERFKFTVFTNSYWRLLLGSLHKCRSYFEADCSSARGDRLFLLFWTWKVSTFSTVNYEQNNWRKL